MKMLNSKIYPSIILIIAVFLTACGPKEDSSSKKIKAVVTIITYADFVQKIGGDKIEVVCMIPPGANAHAFEPQPGKLVEFSKADFYFRVGDAFELENIWTGKISDYNKKIRIVDCSKDITIREHDPHIWLSPPNVKIITMHIFDALSSAYPEDKKYFETNLNNFISQLDSIDELNRNKLAELKSNKFMVYHSAWSYFAEHYGLEEIAIEREGKSPNVRDLAGIVKRAKEAGIKVILTEVQFDPSPAKTIAGEIGAATDSINSLPEDFLKNLSDTVNKIVKYSK